MSIEPVQTSMPEPNWNGITQEDQWTKFAIWCSGTKYYDRKTLKENTIWNEIMLFQSKKKIMCICLRNNPKKVSSEPSKKRWINDIRHEHCSHAVTKNPTEKSIGKNPTVCKQWDIFALENSVPLNMQIQKIQRIQFGIQLVLEELRLFLSTCFVPVFQKCLTWKISEKIVQEWNYYLMQMKELIVLCDNVLFSD